MHTYPFWKRNCLPEVMWNISELCTALTILKFSRPSFSSCITFFLVLNQCQRGLSCLEWKLLAEHLRFCLGQQNFTISFTFSYWLQPFRTISSWKLSDSHIYFSKKKVMNKYPCSCPLILILVYADTIQEDSQCILFNSPIVSPKWNLIEFLLSATFLLPEVFSFLQYIRIRPHFIMMVISFMSSSLIIPRLQKWQEVFLPTALYKHKIFFLKA